MHVIKHVLAQSKRKYGASPVNTIYLSFSKLYQAREFIFFRDKNSVEKTQLTNIFEPVVSHLVFFRNDNYRNGGFNFDYEC